MVISHMDGANWVNSLSFSRAKKIFVVHGTILHDLAQSATMQWFRKKLIIPLLYNQGDITVAVSEGITRELRIECSVKKVINIPNFFEIEQIEQKVDESLPLVYQDFFEHAPVLITSGRLARQKQQHFLFGVYKAVKETHPAVRLVILGDGDERDNLIAQAQSIGLKVYTIWDEQANPFRADYDVYFLGYVSNPYQYLNKSKLFLFPSAWEGFPLALCEAMIAGVPVLASDCPTGPREILLPGSLDDDYKLTNAEFTPVGVLMPMPDKHAAHQEWQNAVGDLLNKPQKCKSLVNAAQLRMKEFGKDKILSRWNDLITAVVEESAG
jgi:glycosyltransferase involved in cell wall biosynthesis